MKKYIVFALFFVSQLHAMKIIRQDSLVLSDDICYLNQMPRDILDYIAGFLMETEEEFIERTRIKKEITQYDDIAVFGYFGFKFARCELCPDEKKYLVIGRKSWIENKELTHWSAENYFHEDVMMIVDSLKSENFEDLDKKVRYKEKIDDDKQYTCHALSRGGGMIAVIYEEKKVFNNGEEYAYDYFKIRKMDTSKERELYIPDEFLHKRIAFNKQGTHLIAHGEFRKTKKPIHKIIPLKITRSAEGHVQAKITHNLQQYLRDKFVCNKFIEGRK